MRVAQIGQSPGLTAVLRARLGCLGLIAIGVPRLFSLGQVARGRAVLHVQQLLEARQAGLLLCLRPVQLLLDPSDGRGEVLVPGSGGKRGRRLLHGREQAAQPVQGSLLGGMGLSVRLHVQPLPSQSSAVRWTPVGVSNHSTADSMAKSGLGTVERDQTLIKAQAGVQANCKSQN